MELNQDARAVLDAMREGINIIDAEGRIIFGNKAYLDFLSKETGIGIGSIEGQYLRDLRQRWRREGAVSWLFCLSGR